MSDQNNSNFPKNFFWGCSTSAHQIEGGLVNDWTEWEKSEKRIKDLKGKNLNPFDYISDQTTNSYLDNNADIVCMKELGLNAYRFSVDWSRIEPKEGVFNKQALDYYLEFIKKLRSHKIEPFVTLWHWPVPLWLRDKGGWQSKTMVHYFNRFVNETVMYLNSDVNFWITLNEPMVWSTMSFLTAEWPPQKRNPFIYLRVINNLINAHRVAYDTIKSIDNNNQIGIAKHNIYFEAYKNRLVNRFLKK